MYFSNYDRMEGAIQIEQLRQLAKDNAKLQAASNSITDQILNYWTQNPDLMVQEKWLHNFRRCDEWNLCLTASTVVARESGATMSRRPRRNHSAAFKAKVALAAIKGKRTIAQLADLLAVCSGSSNTMPPGHLEK